MNCLSSTVEGQMEAGGAMNLIVMPSNSGMGYMGEFREIMEGGWILQIMDLDIH